MKVFLTGATGYIGSAVAGALRGAGYDVIGLLSPGRSPEVLEQKAIRPFRGTLEEPGALAAEAASADAIIHTAFLRSENGALADAALTDAFLGALAGSGKPFLYTSGVWVMGNTKKDADEESPLDPPRLVEWRAGVERKVLDGVHDGVRSVVIRPAMVYGRGGGIPAGFVRSARENGAALVVGNGENHWSFVDVDDLAALYVLALNAEAGSLFIGASGPAYRVKDVAESASHGAGAQGRVVCLTFDEAYPQIGPVSQGLVLDQQISGAKAERTLGWKPKGRDILEDIREGSYVGV